MLVVVLESDNRAQSYQPAVRFNNYLRDEGLAGILAHRENTHRIDERSSFAMPDQGRWLLNVIWSKPLPTTQETDFETFFSSLSFGG